MDFGSLESKAVDGIGATMPKEQPKTPPAPKQEAPKTEAPKVEPKKDQAAPAEEQKPDAKKRPWEIVREREREVAALKAEKAKFEAELKTLKSQPASQQSDPEKEELRKKIKSYEEEIKYVAYQKSPEFQNNYQKPYEDLVAKSVKEATELFVANQDGSERQLSKDEFWGVVTSPTLQHARMSAKALFPDDPAAQTMLLQKRSAIVDKWQAMEQARQEYQTNGEARERQKMEQEQARVRQEQEQKTLREQERASKWSEIREQVKSHQAMKEFITPEETDPKAKELLTKGTKLADLAFGSRNENGEIVGEDGQPVGLDKTTEIDAVIYHRAAAFNHVVHKFRTAQAKIAELEGALKNYRQSDPKHGETPGSAKGAESESWEDEFNKRFAG